MKWGIGLIIIGAAFVVDDPVTSFFQLHSEGWAWTAAGLLSKYGDWPPLLAAGLAVVLLLLLLRRFEAGRLLLVVLIAGMLTGLSATIIRSATGRTRPSAEAPQGFYGLRHDSHWIVGKYEFGSFPSGHTATVAGLTVAAWLVSRRFGAAAAIFGAAVAWSRLALHCHHFSDVVASTVLAIFFKPVDFPVLGNENQGPLAAWQRLTRFRPHEMEKILLGVTGVRPEMRRGKMTQFLFADAAARKIKLLQRALNPDINRKRGIESAGEQQNAVGNLAADAAQFHQLGARFGII